MNLANGDDSGDDGEVGSHADRTRDQDPPDQDQRG